MIECCTSAVSTPSDEDTRSPPSATRCTFDEEAGLTSDQGRLLFDADAVLATMVSESGSASHAPALLLFAQTDSEGLREWFTTEICGSRSSTSCEGCADEARGIYLGRDAVNDAAQQTRGFHARMQTPSLIPFGSSADLASVDGEGLRTSEASRALNVPGLWEPSDTFVYLAEEVQYKPLCQSASTAAITSNRRFIGCLGGKQNIRFGSIRNL